MSIAFLHSSICNHVSIMNVVNMIFRPMKMNVVLDMEKWFIFCISSISAHWIVLNFKAYLLRLHFSKVQFLFWHTYQHISSFLVTSAVIVLLFDGVFLILTFAVYWNDAVTFKLLHLYRCIVLLGTRKSAEMHRHYLNCLIHWTKMAFNILNEISFVKT